jgi:excisionase family DNA binding protein
MSKEIQARLERIETLLSEIKATGSKPLDLTEAAAYLGHSKSHLYQLTSKGLIAHYKPAGKKIYFLKKDLDAYLLRNRRAAADEIEAAAASHIVSHPAAEVGRG